MVDRIFHKDNGKGLIEHAACFGLVAAGLIAVTVVLQWMLNLAS